jgi:hypothetical protein
MRLADLVSRVDQLIQQADNVLRTKYTNREDPHYFWVQGEPFQGFRVSGLSFLAATFGTQHPYYKEFENRVAEPVPDNTEAGRGILGAAREEMAGGWLQTTKGLACLSGCLPTRP